MDSALCCDEETSGFDKLSGRTWIYPTNYPVRDYQFNIIQATILQNTLVSLPTGLGKTFIAAVIMYNYYRWYPLGKIIFTAPTRPLVAQQIDACYNIIGIPHGDTIEMTGHMQVATRKTHWKDKRVFFATPQVIYNDLKSGICPAERIRCLVFDEAHRARGNYAYCQIVATLTEMGHNTYRVLALSATPGSKVEDVINVVRNLQIAHLELRTENCIDVARYSHAKKIHTVVIPLGAELTQLRQQYVEILDTYARRLKQLNILPMNLGNLSRGRVVMLYKEYQAKERGARHPQHNMIMKDFTLLISLCHGLELLVKHGARVFLNFFDEHPEKTWMQADDRLTALLERLRDDLGCNPLALDRSTLPDGTVPEMPPDISFGHPKFDRLRNIMTEHFNEAQKKGQETKAIVFCEYRESVNLVHCLLLQCRPLIKPHMFVGQGASGKDGKTMVSQKQQLRVMRLFREGACNALVATCVAEEGLDVGSVDLIVCFDISTRSPVRLVQRCGRTGRERGGQVYILVTEGREHQTLLECMRQRDNLNKRVLQSREVGSSLYRLNPRMLPRDLVPRCQKMYITVQKKPDPKEITHKKKQPGQQDLRAMLTDRPSSASVPSTSFITSEEFTALFPDGLPETRYFEVRSEYWNLGLDELTAKSHQPSTAKLNLSEWLEWQRTLQSTVKVGHSADSEVLSEVLQYADTKRFDLPTSTQIPTYNTQMMNMQALQLAPEPKKKPAPVKKIKIKPIVEPVRKDGDIRALFSTTKKSTKEYTKLISELGVDNGLPTSLIDIMVDLSADSNVERKCWSCEIIDCNFLSKLTNKTTVEAPLSILTGLNLPDINLLDNINVESIEKVVLMNATNTQDSSEDIFMDECLIIDNLFLKETTAETNNKEENLNCSSNFDLAFDFDFDGSDLEEIHEDKGVSKKNDINFDVGNIEDIFNDSDSPVEAIEEEKEVNKSDPKEALEFFGLDSIDDIFADSNDDDIQIIENSPIDNTDKYNAKQEVNPTDINKSIVNEDPIANTILPKSPSLLSNSVLVDNTIVCSPILCSQKRKRSLSINNNSIKSSTPFGYEISQKALIMKPKSLFRNDVLNSNEVIDLADSEDWSKVQESFKNNPSTSKAKEINNVNNDQSKSMFTITQLINIINKSKDDSNVALRRNCFIQNPQADVTAPEDKSKSCNEKIPDIPEVERSSSPVIFTQMDKSIISKLYATFKQNNIATSKNKMSANPNVSNTSNLVNSTLDERSSSPILFSQLDKKKDVNINQLRKLNNSLNCFIQNPQADVTAPEDKSKSCNEKIPDIPEVERSSSPVIFTQMDKSIISKLYATFKQNNIATSKNKMSANPNVSNTSNLVNSTLDERSSSPILFSQLDKKKDVNINQLRKLNNSLNCFIQNPQADVTAPEDKSKSCNEKIPDIPEVERSSSPVIFTQMDKSIISKLYATFNQNNIATSKNKMSANPNVSNTSNLVNSTLDERSSSPILFSQLDKKKDVNINQLRKLNNSLNNETKHSLVILDSDDSDDTVAYELTPEMSDLNKQATKFKDNKVNSSKRKLNDSADDSMFCSPYFNKRPKLDNCTNKPSLSLKDKLNKMFSKSENKDSATKPPDPTNINFMSTSPIVPVSQLKENIKPKNKIFDEDDFVLDYWFTPQKRLPSSQKRPPSSQIQTIEKLQVFRRDTMNNTEARNKKRNGMLSKFSLDKNHESQPTNGFSDSDDDFVSKSSKNQNSHNKSPSPAVNYKVRKKKKKKPASEFLELEAALSSDASVSGDELVSGDSDLEGSIVDFICDEPVEDIADHTVDMQAHYLRSVKSPVVGMFKIPELPQHCGNVFSQVDPNNDDYEMDSFCVDSHIGLTQAQDVSELELAERKLKKRRKKHKAKQLRDTRVSDSSAAPTADSPVAANKRVKKVKRQISSESSENSD